MEHQVHFDLLMDTDDELSHVESPSPPFKATAKWKGKF